MEIMSYLPISKRCAAFLATRTGLAQEKEIILTYVIEVLVINLLNICLALLLGFFLGVLPGTVACLVTAFFFRHTAGGAHSNSPWRCGLVTVTVFPLIALLGLHLSFLSQSYIDTISAACVLMGLVKILQSAPVDNPAAPIISPLRRKKLKTGSLIVLLVLVLVLIFLRQSPWPYAQQVSLCLALSVLWISLMLSSYGHRIMAWIDGISIKKERFERR